MAYIHHDIDDAIRGQIIQEKELPSDCTEVLGHNVKERLNRMIRDVIAHSVMKPEIRQTPQVEEAMMRLRQFMFENVYIGSIAKAEEGKAEKLVESLVDYFGEHPERLPQVYQERLSLETVWIRRSVIMCPVCRIIMRYAAMNSFLCLKDGMYIRESPVPEAASPERRRRCPWDGQHV